jgi:hypothetical protein
MHCSYVCQPRCVHMRSSASMRSEAKALCEAPRATRVKIS